MNTLPRSGFLGPALGLLLVVQALSLAGCRPSADARATDPHFATNGVVEVTARLVEIPEGAIFQRELYDYATILKYAVVKVHRGELSPGATLYVGHYNPWKPRSEAADRRAPGIGGALRQFRAGELHHLALEAPIDDH